MKYYKFTFNMKFLNILSILIFIIFYIIICLLGYFSYVDFLCLIVYIFWMVLHEFFHGIGFIVTGCKRKNIVYGASLEKGIFYCMCKEIISKRSILISLLFPFVLIGVLTLIIGFIFDIPLLIILSLLNIAGCTGDVCMFLSFVNMPDFSYVDIDLVDSFYLISNSDLSSNKVFGIKLVESGEYKSLSLSNNFKKIDISRLSYIFFIILLILLFIFIYCKFFYI